MAMPCVRKCVILLSVIVTLSVTKQNVAEEFVEKLPASDIQLMYLADEVCLQLQEEMEDENDDVCIENFLSQNKSVDLTSLPSKIYSACRQTESASFKIEPKETKQIIVIVPEDEYIINFRIMEKFEQNCEIDVPSHSLYNSVWSAMIYSNGTSSMWRRGPDVPPWKEDKYNITVEDPDFKFNTAIQGFVVINATFKIHFSGESTPCSKVEVLNRCKKDHLGNSFSTELVPKGDQMLTIPSIALNDKCKIIFRNKSGTVLETKDYSTHIPEAEFDVPEIPQHVTLEAVSSDFRWEVIVTWASPRRIPKEYNLTLLAPGVRRNIVVPGKSTRATFKNILAEDHAYYNVTVAAVTRVGRAVTSRRAQFPEHPSLNLVILTGSLSLLMALVAVVIGFIQWWRRRKEFENHPRDPTGDSIIKPPREVLPEISQELTAEDGWEVRSERLLLHEVIGEGAFGVVRKGTLTPCGREVAVKMLKEFPTLDEIRSFREEMELMKSVGVHPHIVSLVGCCSGRRPLIVTEYCSRGDLLSFLRCSWDMMVSKRNAKYYNNNIENSEYRNDLFKKNDQSNLTPLVVNKLYDLQEICDTELTPLHLLSFCRQIAMGMEYLASNRVVHRDLAARNILVTEKFRLKIADFGLSRDVYQENQYKQKGNGKMPMKWMALESLSHRIYTTQTDVWSFGVVMWEVVTLGGAPYPGVAAARLPRLLRTGYRMPRPNNCTKPLYDLMLSCWDARPRERPTFTELHAALDELLNNASEAEYLSLELDYEPPPTPKAQRYLRMLLRGNKVWARGDHYERPLKALNSNHYTSPPAPLNKIQVV